MAYFSDIFDVDPQVLDEYGAFNISLINDLPLFIDPFLLFNSADEHYRRLHDRIIQYVKFLRDQSAQRNPDIGLLRAWYCFGEVKQNWLGYSKVGNSGRGLGLDFARALNSNLHSVFSDFGAERIAHSSHLEKLCLVADGVGRDHVSDFTTNLIKDYLLDYTATFAAEHIKKAHKSIYAISRVRFNYETESWESRRYELPTLAGDYVLLTPSDMLTKDEMWISKPGLLASYDEIAASVPNEQLRSEINNYFASQLSREPRKQDYDRATYQTLRHFPVLLEYYIRRQEENGDKAVAISRERVSESIQLFLEQASELVRRLQADTRFYEEPGNTYDQARRRVMFLKDVIENKDGYKLFYVNGKPPRPRSGARRWSPVLQAFGQARTVLGGRAGEVARAAAPRLDMRPRPCRVEAALDVFQLGCGQDRRVSPCRHCQLALFVQAPRRWPARLQRAS